MYKMSQNKLGLFIRLRIKIQLKDLINSNRYCNFKIVHVPVNFHWWYFEVAISKIKSCSQVFILSHKLISMEYIVSFKMVRSDTTQYIMSRENLKQIFWLGFAISMYRYTNLNIINTTMVNPFVLSVPMLTHLHSFKCPTSYMLS